jgi:hypothetical protein
MIYNESVLACVDVGSVTGWATLDPISKVWDFGEHIESFRDKVGGYLRDGRMALVGVEATSFLPREQDYSRLFRAREGEVLHGQSRPWSIAAGKNATWSALPLVPNLLADLRSYVPAKCKGHLSLSVKHSDEVKLLLWEAFVTSAPKGIPSPPPPPEVATASIHVWDAAIAIQTLRNQILANEFISAVTDRVAVSLFGAALLATGWAFEHELASIQPHVVRAFKPKMES